jgi:lyso-ornithine lipid O-acyltransferase
VMSRIRAGLIFSSFMLFTIPLIPVQWALLRVDTKAARRFPHWYHKQVCRLLGIRLSIAGRVVRDTPVLIVSNHVSWLDVIVLSALAPVSFVAKKEVASWPFVSTLAKLQRTVFVDRERRISIGDTASEIVARLASGDAIVLFAEGTSSDGNRVLPFRTSLFAAAKPTQNDTSIATAMVQTVSIAYTKRNGLPLGWAGRRALGYYGDVSMAGNAWLILTGGTVEADVHVGEPLLLSDFKNRKDLARRSEEAVRASLTLGLRK